MNNVLVKNDFSKDILEKCKINADIVKNNRTYVLNLSKLTAKRGRKSYEEMSDDDLYNDYVNRCLKTRNNPVSRKIWNEFQFMYEFDELLSTEEIENSNIRNIGESKATKLGYIGDELDYEAIDSLYKLLFKALKKRLVILLDLESVPNIINNALHCRHQGYDCKSINALMNSKLTETRKLLENPNVKEWLDTGASDMSLEASDYVDTYQRVLRQISDIKDEPLEYFKEIIHNEYDLFEDEILKNEYIEISHFSENLDYDEEDEDILD